MTNEDRRNTERVEALVVVQLGEDGRYGVTRDASDRGLLVATPVRYEPGDRLQIAVQDDAGVFRADARVVRVEETPPTETWRYRVALELDERLPRHIVDRGTEAKATLGFASQK